MDWKYVKALNSNELIDDYECMVKYVFCDSFKKCIMEHNGGRPSMRIFDTDKAKEREQKSFLSFNKDDRETVWKIFDWNKDELTDKYIPFAIDNFGNLICFDASNDKIVFVNHEDMTIEMIANDFDTFLNGLYDLG